ncbi:hypothetical protein LBMAG46_22990 [Planctomycetia bacterium]|nr:hypothetical protein LBMAG46_22990 [Planctomycetia bacterium]
MPDVADSSSTDSPISKHFSDAAQIWPMADAPDNTAHQHKSRYLSAALMN